MRTMVRGLAAIVTIGVTAAAAAPAQAATYGVTVARTEYGIPHIKAKDYGSLGYGYARAMAEDVICVVAESYVTANGERSKYFGPGGSYTIRGNGSSANNLNSDFFYQRIKDNRTVEKLVAEPPPTGPKPIIKEALQGYVDGYNAYLKSVGGSAGISDPTCKGKDWVRPITVDDVYRRFYALTLLASSGVAIDGIATAQPLTGAVNSDAMSALQAVSPGEVDRRLGGLGSNAYGIGKAASQDGHGLVYGNPHFPWQGSERFYQAHLTIPGKLDVTGGSLLGVPIVLIGTTHGLAWSHTVSTARRFVPYQLTLVPGSYTSYIKDGQVKQMKADKVTVQTKDGARTRTLWSSEYGPILTSILGLPLFPWNPATAYTIFDANATNFGRLLNHFFDVDHAQTVDELDAIERKYQGIPWVNTIAADTGGTAYYADIGSIPNISRDKYTSCETPLGIVADQLQRLPVLDGSTSACDPVTEPGSIAPGIMPASKEPSLKRDDHVSNMNDSYWLTNPAQPLEGFSRIIGDERTARSLRTRLGIKQLQQRVEGTDGLPGKGFTFQNLMEVGLGDRVYSGEIWRDDLVNGCTSAACEVLRKWDLHINLDSKGAILWERFITRLTGVAPVALPAPLAGFSGQFDVNDPVNTPTGLLAVNPVVVQAFQQAQSDLTGAGLPLYASPRQAQTVTRRGEKIPLHGGIGGAGIFNVITPTWDAKKGYVEAVHGSSFMQAVHLVPGCPELRTFLTYGLSTNPNSVRTSDQTKAFSEKRWVKVPFCAKDLEKDPSADRTATIDTGRADIQVHEARGKARPRVTVTLPKATQVKVVIRRGTKVVRRLTRKAATVAFSPRIARGSYRVDVTIGKKTRRITAKQR